MDISDMRNIGKEKTIAGLWYGDVFEYKNQIYMLVSSLGCDPLYGIYYTSAVHIASGMQRSFENDTVVCQVHGVMKITH